MAPPTDLWPFASAPQLDAVGSFLLAYLISHNPVGAHLSTVLSQCLVHVLVPTSTSEMKWFSHTKVLGQIYSTVSQRLWYSDDDLGSLWEMQFPWKDPVTFRSSLAVVPPCGSSPHPAAGEPDIELGGGREVAELRINNFKKCQSVTIWGKLILNFLSRTQVQLFYFHLFSCRQTN